MILTAGPVGCEFRFWDAVSAVTGTFTLGNNGHLSAAASGLGYGQTGSGRNLYIQVIAGDVGGNLTLQRVLHE